MKQIFVTCFVAACVSSVVIPVLGVVALLKYIAA